MPVRAKASSIFHSSVCWMNEAEDGAVGNSQLNTGSHGEKQQLIETNKSFCVSLVQVSKGMW